MFGHRYFGARYFGPRYFGVGGEAIVVEPDTDDQYVASGLGLARATQAAVTPSDATGTLTDSGLGFTRSTTLFE